MKKLLLLSITLLTLTVACGETVEIEKTIELGNVKPTHDDSQWKSDMEEKIKTLESNKDMPMMEMMHNEEMEEMMGMEERHRDVEELKEKVSALETEIAKLKVTDMQLKATDLQIKGDINETVIKTQVDNSVINMNLNCDLAKRITRSRPKNPDGGVDLKDMQMDFDDITKAVNENDFWYFPNTPSSIDNTVITQDFVSENNLIEELRKKYGSLFLSQMAYVLLTGDSAKEIVENNCN